ncbi:cupin-like domain-containing protein [Cantharellus anzutake]|uniref:cupin-like domain-containing protein n=1 Tax=Cantharellus anzutake TaxID=1750568 RepID=UPI001905B863|nr:cupin-like domain-containing protein [Cantharellus anzutake]KAF8312558.1 cupin-like domain-containing protein [Cantharellus anzutake]
MIDLDQISRDYQELNGTTTETWSRPPSELEFSRLVHIGRPVLFLSDVQDFVALNKWQSDEYLSNKLADSELSVAFTPDGRADALVHASNGTTYFAEPHTQKLTIGQLLSRLDHANNPSSANLKVDPHPAPRMSMYTHGSGDPDQSDAAISQSASTSEVCYLQSQNGNLYDPQNPASPKSEMEALKDDVPRDVPWVTQALGHPPDAVNIWIGDHRSKTSVHSDPYENLYTVVRGTKHFTLFPPTEGHLLSERLYPRAIYTRHSPDGPLVLTPLAPNPRKTGQTSETNKVDIEGDADECSDSMNSVEENMIFWASADTTAPIPGTRPVHVRVHAGETLYLPSGRSFRHGSFSLRLRSKRRSRRHNCHMQYVYRMVACRCAGGRRGGWERRGNRCELVV